MDYKKIHEEALARAKSKIRNDKDHVLYEDDILDIFPELKESDDEKIRKALIREFEGWNKRFPADTFAGFTPKDILVWLEKQGEQKLTMIQWKGDNLKEVIDFTGIDKRFKNWFSSFDEYKTYVNEHGNIFKLFNEDGSHYEIPVGAWIVKTPDGYNIASKMVYKQKPADEPKFKVGDWVTNGVDCTFQIASIESGIYYDTNNCGSDVDSTDKSYHLWTIQDAKDGDVLVDKDNNIGLYQEEKNKVYWNSCIYLGRDNCLRVFGGYHEYENTKPATKEQCDLLFSKMKEAGWEWDAELKQLRKIDEEVNGEDYGIDSLWHAQRILEKTLGSVDGYQSDDGILEHKCAISAVKELSKQNTAWSEADENRFNNLIELVKGSNEGKGTKEGFIKFIYRLKSLKGRVE